MLIKAECDINAVDKNKWTPLMNACYWANEEAVLVLLKAGANSDIRNIDGRTALHEVCRSPSLDKEEVLARIAKRLIQSGSDANLSSSSQVIINSNFRIFMISLNKIQFFFNFDDEFFMKLFDFKEDLNALMYAAYHNHVGVANVLIEHNCDLDSTDYVIKIFGLFILIF